MRAQILSIGDEILGGYITDTNAAWLAQHLAAMNIELTQVTQVGDDLEQIVDVIEDALGEAAVIICTGGVGPTEDDLTREAIAAVAGETPVVDETLLADIRAFFSGRGLEMPERNAKQAWVIPSCEPLPNPVGTAPGWYVTTRETAIIAMPGVPREMFRMWNEQAAPRIARLLDDHVIRSTTLKTIGIGESMVEQELHHLITRADPIIATYAKDDGVHIRVTATGSDALDAGQRRDACVNEIAAIVGSFIYSRDDESLPGTLLSLLRGLDYSLAIADCGGGGRFASMLAGIPSAHEVLLGTTMQPLGIPDMATGIATSITEDFESDIGIGISVSVEDAGNAVYASQIDIAVAGKRLAHRSFTIRSGFEDIQRRSALFAAEVLRQALLSD